MSIVIADRELQSRLSDVNEAELLDPSGVSLGRFLSEQGFRRLVIEWANANIATTELEASLREPGGCSLSEVWKRLGA